MLEEDDIALGRFAAYVRQRYYRSTRFLGSGKDGVVHEAESNDWNQKLGDDFGARADDVRRMLAALSSHGVILLDVHPGNIRFV